MKLSIILALLPAISLALPVYETDEQLGPLISIVAKAIPKLVKEAPKIVKEAPKIVKGVEKIAPKVAKEAPKIAKSLPKLSNEMRKALSKLSRGNCDQIVGLFRRGGVNADWVAKQVHLPTEVVKAAWEVFQATGKCQG